MRVKLQHKEYASLSIIKKNQNCRGIALPPAVGNKKRTYGAPAGAGLGIIDVRGTGPAGVLAPNFVSSIKRA
jgi:hypothetical protein